MPFHNEVYKTFLALFHPRRNRDANTKTTPLASPPSVLSRAPSSQRPGSSSITTTSNVLNCDQSQQQRPISKALPNILVVADKSFRIGNEHRVKQPLYPPEVRRQVEDIIVDDFNQQNLGSDTSIAPPPPPPYIEPVEHSQNYGFTGVNVHGPAMLCHHVPGRSLEYATSQTKKCVLKIGRKARCSQA